MPSGDSRGGACDLERLKKMYNYLNRREDLYYIKYRNRLCGDVCLHPDGEINIAVAAPFQNRRGMGELVRMAREKGVPRLYAGDRFLQRSASEDVRARGGGAI